MYRDARDALGLSRDEAAFRLHIGSRTLVDYEAGKTVPPPDVVLGMSKLYRLPWLTQIYCKEHCAIGEAYSYEVLNGVNLDPASVLVKLSGEMEEAQAVLSEMFKIAVNKNSRSDFSDREWTSFIKCLHEFFDVEHNIECLKISLGSWCDVSELIKEHNEKCWQRKYVVKEKSHLRSGRLKINC